MGKIVKAHIPCLDQVKCKSSDAMNIYEDGTATCFSCRRAFKKSEVEAGMAKSPEDEESFSVVTTKKSYGVKSTLGLEEIAAYGTRGFRDRGITKDVCEKFGVKVSYNESGEIDTHYYPYGEGLAIKGYKVRRLPKHFSWVGESTGLFGKMTFNSGGKRLVICEGEIDALSVAQAYHTRNGNIYPVVAISSATMLDALLANRDWIRTFSEVVLFLDNDERGQEATAQAVKIIGVDKARLCKFGLKDANEVLVQQGSQSVLQIVWDAQPWTPVGIMRRDALWTALVDYNQMKSMPYPPCIRGVNTKTKGKRKGEIILLISGTGSGKSTILRECIMHDLEQEPEDKVGILSLEESPAETTRKLSGMALNRNPAEEEIPIEELKIGFDKVFGDDRVIVLDHQGAIDDGSVVDQLEYMALCGCTNIYVDHITMLASEGSDELKGNEAVDKIMNDFLKLVKRQPISLVVVSHLRKVGQGKKPFEEGTLPSMDDIKGSGSIKQVSFDIIAFARNMIADDDRERNTIIMRVLKCRFTGLTGNIPGAIYDQKTGRL